MGDENDRTGFKFDIEQYPPSGRDHAGEDAADRFLLNEGLLLLGLFKDLPRAERKLVTAYIKSLS